MQPFAVDDTDPLYSIIIILVRCPSIVYNFNFIFDHYVSRLMLSTPLNVAMNHIAGFIYETYPLFTNWFFIAAYLAAVHIILLAYTHHVISLLAYYIYSTSDYTLHT